MNRNRIIKMMSCLFLCLFLFYHFTLFSYAMGENVKKIAEKVDPDTLTQAESDDIFFEDNGTLYKANGKDLFTAMKKDYGDEEWTDGETTKPWKNVGSMGDFNDASTFQGKIGASSGLVMTMCKNLVKSILTFDDDEMHIPLILLKEYIAPIAFTLTVLYALNNIGKERERDRKSPQTIVKCLIPMVIGIVAINFSGKIFGSICDFAVAFLRDVSSKLNSASVTATAGYTLEELKEIAMLCDTEGVTSFFSIGGGVLAGGITSAAMMIVSLILAVMCYGLKLTFGIRLMCLPLALADCSAGAIGTKGFAYIKGLLGEGMAMGLIVAMIEIAGSMGENGVGIACLAVPFSCIAAFGQIKQIAKEAMGV